MASTLQRALAPRWTPITTAVATYLSVRIIGIVVLAYFGALHNTDLTDLLAKWDGRWMLDIAEYGYGGVPESATDANGVHTGTTAYAFFPGYPVLIGLIAKLPLMTAFTAGILLNIAAGCAAAIAIGRIGTICARRMRPELSDAATARVGLLLVVAFAAAPMGVVLSMTYTEALFCALAAWALVGVLEQRWLLAGASAFAVGLVRPTGVAVIAVVMLAAVLAKADRPRSWIAVVMAPLGYLGYLGVVWAKTGSPTGWFTIQTDGWDSQIDGGQATAKFVFASLTSAQDAASVLAALIVITTVVLLIWSIVDRVPWPVLTYGILIAMSVLLSSGLMLSRPRLLLPAYVLMLPVVVRLATLGRTWTIWITVGATLGSAWFGAYMLAVFPYAI